MDILIIGLLITLGVLLMLAEIFILAGVSVAAIGSFASFGAALYLSYDFFGTVGFLITTIITLIILGFLFYLSVKRKTLKRLSLNEVIDSKSSEDASSSVKIGDLGTTKTRLNPIGNVQISGLMYEGRSLNGLIDQNSSVVVVGFEGNCVIVEQNK